MLSSTRRSVLASFALATMQARSHERKVKLGCQTNAWPIKPTESSTLFAALANIREIGFSGFETGFANLVPVADQAAAVKEHSLGLTPFGVHIFLPHYDPATLIAPPELITKVAELGAKMGFERLILSGGPATDAAAFQRKIQALNRYGRQAKDLGLTLAYHNHGPEFAGAQPEIDRLVADTDPSLVWFLLDAGHAFEANADLVGFVDRHSERLTGLHLRDYKDGQQVPLGEGDFPLAEVAKVLRRRRWSGWALAEEERLDGSKPGNSAAGPAFAALHKAFEV